MLFCHFYAIFFVTRGSVMCMTWKTKNRAIAEMLCVTTLISLMLGEAAVSQDPQDGEVVQR